VVLTKFFEQTIANRLAVQNEWMAFVTGKSCWRGMIWISGRRKSHPESQVERAAKALAERATLGEIGHRFGRKVLGEAANMARPDTVLAWYRKLVVRIFDGSKAGASTRQSGRLSFGCILRC
jgi:hypothetical protein